MMSLRKIFLLWGPVLLWAVMIFSFSGVPDFKTALSSDFILRKIAHITEYFVLVLLLTRAFSGSFAMNAARLLIYPAIIALLYAISDEFHQSFIPGRTCAMTDVFIDVTGIILAAAVVRISRTTVSEREKNG